MKTLYLYLCLLLSGGCRTSDIRIDKQQAVENYVHISNLQAIEIAKQKFSELYPARLATCNITVDSFPEQNAWYILFIPTNQYSSPGSSKAVIVNKASGEATVLPSY